MSDYVHQPESEENFFHTENGIKFYKVKDGESTIVYCYLEPGVYRQTVIDPVKYISYETELKMCIDVLLQSAEKYFSNI